MEALLRELVAKVDVGSKMEHFEAKLDAVSEQHFNAKRGNCQPEKSGSPSDL